ncbi:organic cation transporter protein-like [Choristoneura fumiferana]|uniref:organic cation transporter protein-like n=1 Tax=Choristoneura fumiferana TaxID=7141 RepID=UPI003D15D90C
MCESIENQRSKSTENVIDLDRILKDEVGECGLYQMRVLALCAVLCFIMALGGNNYIFFFAKSNTRCLIPECESYSPQLNFTPSWISKAVPAAQGSFDSCHRYANTSVNASDFCSAQLFDRESVIKCEDYVYESKNSAYYEFNLACDDWRPNLIGSVKFIGFMISLPITGFVADRWGRRLALFLTINCSWISCIKYWINSYTSYIILEFLEALIGGAAFSCVFILAIEYVGSKHRAAAGAAMTSFVAMGLTLQSIISWTGIYWRYLILIFNAPLLIVIFCLWIAPESVRWLMSKGRYEESKVILENAAKMNGNILSDKTLKDLSEGLKLEEKNKNESEPWLICLVFSHKRVLFHCILTPFWWITYLFIFYGLTMSAVTISGNMYLNYSAVYAIEIPGHCLAFLLLNRIGRKLLLTSGFWICGACQVIYMLVPHGYYWQSLCIYLTGKLSITVVVTAVYVYTAELFPTRYRTTLLTYSSMIGRLGAIFAPLTPSMSSAIWELLPFVLFAGMAFLSGLLVLLAPETLGVKLPDTMQEANDLGRHSHSSILKPLRRLLFRQKSYTLR